MVATLVALRLRVLGNSLARSPWQMVATILGGIWALGVLAMVVVGLVALNFVATVSLTGTILTLAGSALILGWMLIPLIATGIDQTLEPAKLAQFPIPLPTLLVALTVTGILGIPGLATIVASLATAGAWIRHPASAVLAVVCGAIGALTAIVVSRVSTAVGVGLRSTRRMRELGGVLILIPLMLLAPIIIGVVEGLSDAADVLPSVANALGWTPLGAAWAAPGALAAGDVLGAALRVLIAIATLGLLLALWRPVLSRALEAPGTASGRTVSRGALGLFARVPQTPAGAVMARCLTYWRRDPRYLRQLIVVPLIPILLWFYSTFTGAPGLIIWSGPFLAFIFAVALATDISFDGTAFATHLIAGVRGRDDRWGRAMALAVFAVPVTLVVGVGSVVVADQWTRLPALLGLSMGLLLTGIGVTAVSSARYVMPVPQAGDSPFKTAPGAGVTTGLQLFVVWGILAVLLLPTVVLVLLDFFLASPTFGWFALGCGVASGIVVVLVGVRQGGALLDRTGPSLLASLRRMRGA